MAFKCVICFEYFGATHQDNNEVSIVTTICGHIFHNNCIEKWMKQSFSCPECRSQVRKESLTKLFINFCIDDRSDSSVEKYLDELKVKLHTKDLECTEKDEKLRELLALSQRVSAEKDREITKILDFCAQYELENLREKKKIKELQTSFARSRRENVEKNYRQHINLLYQVHALEKEVKRLKHVDAENQNLLKKNKILLKEKNILETDLQHLNTVKTIVERCFTDVKKILADTQVLVSSEEEKKAIHRTATYSLPAPSQNVKTYSQNELTSIKQEENKSNAAQSKEKKTLLHSKLKHMKRQTTIPQSNSTDQVSAKRQKINDLNSSSINESCAPSPVPIMPHVTNNHSSPCYNFKNYRSSITKKFPKAERPEIEVIEKEYDPRDCSPEPDLYSKDRKFLPVWS